MLNRSLIASFIAAFGILPRAYLKFVVFLKATASSHHLRLTLLSRKKDREAGWQREREKDAVISRRAICEKSQRRR